MLYRWSQSEQQSLDYGDFYRRNGSIASSQGGQSESNVRVVRFRKIGGTNVANLLLSSLNFKLYEKIRSRKCPL